MPYIGKEPARVPVTAADIPDNSITAAKIVDGVITIADIANDAVTEDKLANSINTAIAANTAKVGITSGQASAITANTAKTGITSGQASAITANTAKTGITSGQASAITANTAKVTNYNQTKSDIDALGIAASSITGALPAISGAALTGIVTGKVLQVVTSSNTNSFANIAGAGGSDGGTSGAGSSVFAVSFTPVASTSTIIVTTNPIWVYEATNAGDYSWGTLYVDSVHKGACNRGADNNVGTGGRNFGFIGFNNSMDSWSGAKTIYCKVGMDGTHYINSSSSYDARGTNNLVIMEIGA